MARPASTKTSFSERPEAVADQAGPGRRRWFWRTSLSLLLAAAMFVAVGSGIRWVQAHQQRLAIKAVRGLGGFAERKFEPASSDADQPPWYQVWLGDDAGNSVSVVRLAGTEASDLDLIAVGKLTDLRMLDLRDTRITDQGLRHLGRLRNLEVLILSGTAVSDPGLEHLAGMTGLKVLCLDETKITSGCLPLLLRFPQLGWLNLSNTAITAAGLSHLRACPALEVLIVAPCPVSPEDMRVFQQSVPGVQVYDGTRRRPAFHHFSYKHFR
jgi:hypothetical protein